MAAPQSNGIEPIAYKGAEASNARTADRKLGFYNKRSETWWKLREALDPSRAGGSGIELPDDQELLSDLTSVRFSAVQHRGAMCIKAETKEDVVKRLGRSPDIATPMAGAVHCIRTRSVDAAERGVEYPIVCQIAWSAPGPRPIPALSHTTPAILAEARRVGVRFPNGDYKI